MEEIPTAIQGYRTKFKGTHVEVGKESRRLKRLYEESKQVQVSYQLTGFQEYTITVVVTE